MRLLMDRAGGAPVKVPKNLTIILLPSRQNIWQHLRRALEPRPAAIIEASLEQADQPAIMSIGLRDWAVDN